MIRDDRDKLAEMIRHLASGQLTIKQFAESAANARLCESNDRDVRLVLSNWLSWLSDEDCEATIAHDLREQLTLDAAFLYSNETCPFWFRYQIINIARLIVLIAMGIAILSAVLVDRIPALCTYWIPYIGMLSLLIALFTAITAGLIIYTRSLFTREDYRYYPFWNRKSLERAKKHPRLLVGNRNRNS